MTVDKIEGAALVDHLKSLGWTARKARFHSKADPALLAKARAYLCARWRRLNGRSQEHLTV